ncbi:hypothetical protein D910_09014 [Dendroctonus ponderosae]
MSTAVMDETSGRNSDRPRLQRTENISKCNLTGRESLHSLLPTFIHLGITLNAEQEQTNFKITVNFTNNNQRKTRSSDSRGSTSSAPGRCCHFTVSRLVLVVAYIVTQMVLGMSRTEKPWKYLKCVSFYAITGSKTSTAPNEGSIAVDL